MRSKLLAMLLLVGSEAAPAEPKISHEKYTLPNGLEVILHKDKDVPLVAVDLWYHVGSAHETPGKSGFAHLFEHMMFQGSKHVGEDAHFRVLEAIGASQINGSTTENRTNYFEVVPSHQLETALWLESDRMGYLLELVNETSLANQRDVVRNERRQRYDNVPYGKELFAMRAALYPAGHPYHYPVIGLHEDLARASLEDVKAFFQKWYVPANATLVVAGDFEVDGAKKLVDKWFGSFPVTTRPEPLDLASPTITATRHEEIKDNFAKLVRVHYAWHSPKMYAPGDAELDIVAQTLGAEGTGRLYKILVHEKQLAQNVSVSQRSDQFASSFHVVVDLKTDADLEAVTKILDDEIEKVRSGPISTRELARAVTQFEASQVWSLEELLKRAELLQLYNQHVGIPDYLGLDIARYRQSSPEKVQEIAARYLAKENRVEIITLPDTQGGAK